jgi:hypothetical protein
MWERIGGGSEAGASKTGSFPSWSLGTRNAEEEKAVEEDYDAS